MAILYFPLSEVLELARHASEAGEHTYGYDVLFDPAMHKGGRVKTRKGESWPDKTNIDMAKVKPGLMLVKDRGVYLMSNGKPMLPGVGKGHKVVYAEGCNPLKDDDCWDASRMAMGGDDTVITWFDLVGVVMAGSSRGHDRLRVEVSEDTLRASTEASDQKEVAHA